VSALDDLGAVIREALRDAGVRTAVIGIDVSANEHLEGAFEPHWALHLRVHIPGAIDPSAAATLRSHFPASGRIPRPFRLTQFDGDLTGIAYGMKPSFERRQSYEQEKPTATGHRRCRNTRGRPLRGTEAVELLTFLDRIGLRRRLILHETALARDRDGSVVIRPRHPPRAVHPPTKR
jgi:hypothetical protein